PEAAVVAARLDSHPAVRTRVVGVHEGRDDEVTRPHAADVAADLLDDADELVGDAGRLGYRVDPAVRPQVAAAHARCGDPHQRIGGLGDAGVGDVFDTDVAGRVQDGGLHGCQPATV